MTRGRIPGIVKLVTTGGALTATDATISGTVSTSTGSSSSDYWTKMSGGFVYGGINSYSTSSYTGYISFNQYHTNSRSYGTRVAGRAMIALLTPILAVAGWASVDGGVTAYAGVSRTISYVESLNLPTVTVTPVWETLTDIARCDTNGNVYGYYSSVSRMSDVRVSVGVTGNVKSIAFTKGLMTTDS